MSEPLGVLIFTPRRDVRRAVFDALDLDGGFVLLSARDAAQLETLLADAPPLHVVVVGADGNPEVTRGLRILRGFPGYATLPLVHVVDDAPGVAPEGAIDWLRESAIPTELAQRVRAALDAPPTTSSSGPAQPDWRFAFDAGAAWVVASTPDGCIVESGAAMERLCAGEGPVQGRLLQELIVLTDGANWPVPDCDGLACTLRRRDGSEIVGEADVRHIVDRGQHRIAVAFRDLRSADTAQRALSLLASLESCQSDDEGIGEAAAMVADMLDLDVVAVWSALPESELGPEVVARIWNVPGQVVWPDANDLPLLKICLGGESLLSLDATSDLPMDDPLVEALGLRSYALLPLLDERRNVLGALLAGRRRQGGDARVLGLALRVFSKIKRTLVPAAKRRPASLMGAG